MKRAFALILAIVMLFLLCACGGKSENNSKPNKDGTIAHTPEEAVENTLTMYYSYLDNCNWYGFNLSSTLSSSLYSLYNEDYDSIFDDFKEELLLEFEDLFTNSTDSVVNGRRVEIDWKRIGKDKINSFKKEIEQSVTVDELISSMVDFLLFGYSVRDELITQDGEKVIIADDDEIYEINISNISTRQLVGDEYREVYEELLNNFYENADNGWVYLFTPSGITKIYAASYYINTNGVSNFCGESFYVFETDVGCFGYDPYASARYPLEW